MASTPLVNLRLPKHITEQVDRLAAAQGCTRSDVLRQAIELVLASTNHDASPDQPGQ